MSHSKHYTMGRRIARRMRERRLEIFYYPSKIEVRPIPPHLEELAKIIAQKRAEIDQVTGISLCYASQPKA